VESKPVSNLSFTTADLAC